MDSSNSGLIALSAEEMQAVNGGSFWEDFWTGVLNTLTTYVWPWADDTWNPGDP